MGGFLFFLFTVFCLYLMPAEQKKEEWKTLRGFLLFLSIFIATFFAVSLIFSSVAPIIANAFGPIILPWWLKVTIFVAAQITIYIGFIVGLEFLRSWLKEKRMKAPETGKGEIARQHRDLESREQSFRSAEKEIKEENKNLKNHHIRNNIDAYFGHDALRQCAGVYVISRCDEGVVKVKVGMTKDFSRRFSQIKSHCRTAGIPEITPEILVPISVGRADVESAVLEQLSAHWESGEWFRMPVEDAINAVLTIALQHRLGKLESRRYIKPWEKRR